MFESETGAMLKVNFFNNNANIDTINGPYTGFLAYPKQVILRIVLNQDKKNLFFRNVLSDWWMRSPMVQYLGSFTIMAPITRLNLFTSGQIKGILRSSCSFIDTPLVHQIFQVFIFTFIFSD